MNHTLLRGCALLMLLLLGYGVFGARSAYAYHITCTNPSMSALSFGNVDPQSTQTDVTATFSATCESDAPFTPRAATICLSIGEPGAGQTNPRQMSKGSDKLNFQLYQDSARSIIWGSQSFGSATPLKVNIVIGPKGTLQINETMYGRVLSGQPAVIPGLYTQIYTSADTAMTVNYTIIDRPAPDVCQAPSSADLRFPFTVSANVIKKCTVAASPLNFGTNPSLLNTTVTADTNLSVQCSNGTAYNVGLNAGQNGGGDINARKMVLGSNSVHYQLYRDFARTQVWGNTIGSNTVAATGNGNTQNLTVYGNVPPQTTPPAGTYSDTVIVTVTY